MKLFNVEMTTDHEEFVCVEVQASDENEALAIGTTMLENGECDCLGRTCVTYAVIPEE